MLMIMRLMLTMMVMLVVMLMMMPVEKAALQPPLLRLMASNGLSDWIINPHGTLHNPLKQPTTTTSTIYQLKPIDNNQ